MASTLLTVQPGSMESEPLCTHISKTIVTSMYEKYWTSVCKFCAEQTSSLQVVLESSNDQYHADENDGCQSKDASGDAVGNDNNVHSLDV
jgi:hypothetical protein